MEQSRRLELACVVVLACCVSLSGCLSGTSSKPAVEITNNDDTAYSITVYTAPGVTQSQDVSYQVTTEAGNRRFVRVITLLRGSGYSNATLSTNGTEIRKVTVGAGEQKQLTLEEWTPELAWTYTVETADSKKTVVGANVVTCENQGHSYTLTITESGKTESTLSCS